jgi:hypothetical protein
MAEACLAEACLRWLHAAVQPCRQREDDRPKVRLASALDMLQDLYSTC